MSSAYVAAIGDAYTRAVSKILGTPGRSEFNALTNGISRIEQAINAQNSAHFAAAKMALARNDISLTLERLENGLAVDPINAKAWMLYADLLMAQNQRDLAQKVVAQCVEWFGPHCPAIPEDVKKIYLSQDKVQGNIKATVHPPDNKFFSCWEADWYGLSKRGLAVAYEKRAVHMKIIFVPALKYQGLDTSILKSNPRTVFPQPVTIFSDDNWRFYEGAEDDEPDDPFDPFYTVTDRYLVTTNNVVIDLAGDFNQTRLSDARVEENFGSEMYGCTKRLSTNDPIIIRGSMLGRKMRGSNPIINFEI